MSNIKKLMMSAAGGGGGLNVEDVFSTYLYEGDDTNPSAKVNGIDLAGEGGMVWLKSRTGATNNYVADTEQPLSSGGGATWLYTNTTDAAIGSVGTGLLGFNSDGFSTFPTGTGVNNSSHDYASWTFRKAPKFFDVVTVTTSGSNTNLRISHSLGTTVGCIIAKRADGAGDWVVWHKGLASATNSSLNLNLTSSVTTRTNTWGTSAPTSTDFGIDTTYFGTSATYVFYLFAHNDGDGEFGPTGDQDIIKCGSYTGAGHSGVTVNLGFEPQFIMIKRSNASALWTIIDNMRGMPSEGNSNVLYPNTSQVEADPQSNAKVYPTPTGLFIEDDAVEINNSGSTYIYMAIRRGPMAVPESATDVFDMHTGSAYNTVFNTSVSAVDLAITTGPQETSPWYTGARLQGGYYNYTNDTNAELGGIGVHGRFDVSDGYAQKQGSSLFFTWMWKRAPGFFDVVAYEGTGTANHTVKHNLGVVPEMIWLKDREDSQSWIVYHKDVGNSNVLLLNTSSSALDSNNFNDQTPTATEFYLGGTNTFGNYANANIAYLFATLPGISKVGSYTGDGTSNSSKVIDCGFTSGARFVLIKAATGEANNWFVFDTERGIVAGFDARLILNLTNTEAVNADYIDPHNSGFIVGAASNTVNAVNVSGVTYIFYAVA